MTSDERLAAALGTMGTGPARLDYRDPDAIEEELRELDRLGLNAESIARIGRNTAEEEEPATDPAVQMLADARRRELSPEAILADEELQKLGGALRARSRVRRKKRTLEAATRLLGKKPDRDFLKEEKPEERELSRREEAEAEINAADAKAFAEAVRKLDMADPASVGDVAALIDKFLGKVQNAFNTMATSQTDAAARRAGAKITELNNLRSQTQALQSLTSGPARLTEDEAVKELAATSATNQGQILRVLKKLPDAQTRQSAFNRYKVTLREVAGRTEAAKAARENEGPPLPDDQTAGADSAEPVNADAIIANVQTLLDAMEAQQGATVLPAEEQAFLDETKIAPLLEAGAFSVKMPAGAPVENPIQPITSLEDFREARNLRLPIVVSPEYANSLGEYINPLKAQEALREGTSDMAKAIKMYQGAGEKTYASAFNAMLDQIDPAGKGTDEDFLTRIKRGYGVEDAEAITKRGEEQKVKLREAQEASLGKLPDTRPTQLTTDEISRRYMQRLDTLTGGKLALADRPERFGMRTLRAQQAAIRGRPDPTKAMRRERFLDTEDEDEDEAG